mgnify:CR=1 FL=1
MSPLSRKVLSAAAQHGGSKGPQLPSIVAKTGSAYDEETFVWRNTKVQAGHTEVPVSAIMNTRVAVGLSC